MRAQKVLARDFQFYFPDLDNIVLVECHPDESVIVRASRNNVPDDRKIFFIRKLAAEGFIPDSYQWFSGSMDGANGLLWIKDYSWLETTQLAVKRKSNRAMKRMLVAACVLWLAMMRVLLVSNHQSATARASPKAPPARSFVPGQTLTQLDSQHRAVTDHHAAGDPPLSAVILEEHGANKLDQH